MFSAPITRLRTFAARGITATTGNDCPGADRKSFCLLLGKKFCGMYISPLDWRRRLWLSVPPATGTHTGVWHRTQQRAGTRRNDEERFAKRRCPLHPGGLLPGCRERRSRRDRGGATGTVAASQGVRVRDGSPPGRRQLRWLRSRQPAPPGGRPEKA